MHVVVIGAGVIGLTSAWYLAREGVQVTLVDRHADVAQETSFANGGQLSYSYVAPLADPAVLPKLPQWLLQADSPLRFRPRLDPVQWRWCLAFLRACTSLKVRQTIGEMMSLSLRSRALMEALLVEHPLAFDLRRTGKLVVYRNAEALTKARPLVEMQRALGADQQVLDTRECLEREPALQDIAERLQGGIYTPSEATGDCWSFCEALLARLRERDNVRCVLGANVLAVEAKGAHVTGIRTDQGVLEADAYVVAAGMDSVRLTRPLGLSLPLYALRGYSLTAAPGQNMRAPELSVTDASRKIVFAPLGNRLRIAAMVDMGVGGAAVDPARIALLKRQVAETFPRLDLSSASPWAGLRPSTATSKPIIDRAGRYQNLWLNTGHGALGFTLACASAEHLASRLLARVPAIDGQPFALGNV
jgi:D-amino-acid dehydrogenase